jgi:hypothetical protein
MMRDKSMSLKLEDNIVFTNYELCKDVMQCQRAVSVFAGCGGYQWPILAGKRLQ